MKGRLAKEAGIKVLSMDLNWLALGFIFVVSINPLCFATIFDFLNSSIHIHYSLLVIADEELDSLHFLRLLRLFRIGRTFRFLKHSKVGADLTSNGSAFQVIGASYEKELSP